MKFKTSLKRVLASLTVSLTAITMIVPSISVSAATLSGTADDYLWVYKEKNVSNMNFTEFLNGDDVEVTKDTANNTVNLAFTSDSDDVTNRTQTEVRLDTSFAPGKNHYVSFDIKMDKHSEFVATMDLPDADGFRPYSFYLGKESWVENEKPVTVTRASALEHDPDKYFVKGGQLVNNDKGWWNKANGGITWADINAPINVKLVSAAEYSYKNAEKIQNVYVYINGNLVGKSGVTGASTKANEFFNFDTLRLIHYATEEGTENITLSNIEVGYTYEGEAYCATNDIDVTQSNPTWFPEGDKAYIKYTLPTTSTMEWDVLPTKGNTNLTEPSGDWTRAMWTGQFGAVANWELSNGGLTAFKGFDESTGLITGADEWTKGKLQAWGSANGSVEILLTLDRVNGTYTTERVGYPGTKHTVNGGDWAKAASGQVAQFRTGTPTYTDMATQGVTAIPSANLSWNTANFAIAIETGVVMDRELTVAAVEEADEVTRIIPSGVGEADSDKVQVIIVQKDSEGYLLQPMMFEKTVRNGIYYLGTPNDPVKKNLVDEAVSATVYIWDNMKPLCTPLELSLTNSSVGE